MLDRDSVLAKPQSPALQAYWWPGAAFLGCVSCKCQLKATKPLHRILERCLPVGGISADEVPQALGSDHSL